MTDRRWVFKGPRKTWALESAEDLGEPIGQCEACGKEEIRYAHHISHLECADMTVGIVCVGKLTAEYEGGPRTKHYKRAKDAEKALKAKASCKARERKKYFGYYNNLPWTPLPGGSEGGCALVGDRWIRVKKLNYKWVIDCILPRRRSGSTEAPVTLSAFIEARSFIEAAHLAVWQFG